MVLQSQYVFVHSLMWHVCVCVCVCVCVHLSESVYAHKLSHTHAYYVCIDQFITSAVCSWFYSMC